MGAINGILMGVYAVVMVYTISRPKFWNSYTIIQDCLFGLSGLEDEF